MGCNEAREWMSLRLDGQLEPAEEEQLSEHLRGCPSCALAWSHWQELDGLLRTAPAMAPPEGLLALVMERLRQQRARQIAGSLVVIGLQVTGLSVLVLGAVAYWLHGLAPVLLQVPYLMLAARFAAAHLLTVAGVLGEAIGVLMRVAVSSRSALLAPAYALLAAGVMAAWLRVVFRRRPAAGGPAGA
jgi:anti-sigma factor RsiW